MQVINGQNLTLINKGWVDTVLGKHARVYVYFVSSVIKVCSALYQHVQRGS